MRAVDFFEFLRGKEQGRVSMAVMDAEKVHRQIGFNITGRSLDECQGRSCLDARNDLIPNIVH